MVTDGSGEVGAAKLTNEVLMIMSSVPTTVKNMTGVDITQQLSRSGLTGSRVSLAIKFLDAGIQDVSTRIQAILLSLMILDEFL